MTDATLAAAPFDLDVLGVLYTEPQDDAERPTPLPGWHVNTSAAVPGWEAWRVLPATPRRVFAGAETVHYRFDSQAEYSQALENASPQV